MNELKLILSLPKTVYFNFRLFPVKQAMRLPILVSNRTRWDKLHRGTVKICGNIRPAMIRIGFFEGTGRVEATGHTMWSVDKNGKVVFNGDAAISLGSSIRVTNDAILSFGSNFHNNYSSHIFCRNKISFGNDNLLGWNCLFLDGDGHKISWEGHTNSNAPIKIGNHVWIASEVAIFKGVTIRDNCVVAFGSKVNKGMYEANSLIAGVPAKVFKQNIEWEE